MVKSKEKMENKNLMPVLSQKFMFRAGGQGEIGAE
jgi:hypothetical protein